jgi:nucleotide-binding universal stress UspA family protein
MNTSVIRGSVVVGVDGSPHSDVAIDWAVHCAQSQHRPLTIVHAAGKPGITEALGDDCEVRRDRRIAGRQITDRALARVQKADPSFPVSVWMTVDDARDTLRTAAKDASVLVLGTRGRGTLARWLLGSVSADVSAHAPCPVVVVRPPADGSLADTIVVGVDGTAASAGAIEFGFELASWEHKPLIVLHAVGDGASPYLDLDLLTYEQRLALSDEHELQMAESLAGFAEKYPDVVASQRLVQDPAAKALGTASRQAWAVVVGSRGRGGAAAALLGSVSRSLVEHAQSTVAVVRH